MAQQSNTPGVEPRTLKLAYRSIFSGARGKIVMADLKQICHVDMPTIVPGDPHMTSYNEGKRFIFLRICKLANLDLDSLMGAVSDNRKTRSGA